MDWRTTMHANELLTIFQESLHMYYSWNVVRKPFACMVILRSMTNLSHSFKKKKDLSTWIGEQTCMQMGFRQFSRNNTYVCIPGKLSETNLHAWLFSRVILVGLVQCVTPGQIFFGFLV